jgi:hypothetical protein
MAAGASEHAAEDAHPVRRDRLVGRQHQHHLVLGAIDREGRKRNGGRRISSEWLDEDRRARDLRANEPFVASVRDHRDVVGDAVEAGHGRLEQRLVTGQRQERFRTFGSAQRVQPGPAPAGHDHRVHVALILGSPRPTRSSAG